MAPPVKQALSELTVELPPVAAMLTPPETPAGAVGSLRLLPFAFAKRHGVLILNLDGGTCPCARPS